MWHRGPLGAVYSRYQPDTMPTRGLSHGPVTITAATT
jgi:hypothetical protein